MKQMYADFCGAQNQLLVTIALYWVVCAHRVEIFK
jgi:hypothetical protein